MEGRAPGTAGNLRAGAYIVSTLREIGVAGAAPNGTYTAQMPLQRIRYRGEPALRFELPGRPPILFAPDEFHTMGRGVAAYRSFTGPVVSIGTAREAVQRLEHIESLQGKVVVLTAGGAPIEPMLEQLEARRASAVVVLVPDSAAYMRFRLSRGTTRFTLPGATGTPGASIPMVVLGGTRAANAFASTTTQEPGRLSLRMDVEVESIGAENILATVPARLPALRDSLVVFVAHYDHVGVVSGLQDSVYNGFVDNATGVAVLLELARVIRASPLDYSTVFVFANAEEEGRLGTQHLLATDSLLRQRTVLSINIDHPPPLAIPRAWYIESNNERAERAARNAVTALGTTVEIAPPRPTSDHWSFVSAGIPALFLVPGDGWIGVTPEQEQSLVQRWWHPHRAYDHWSAEFPLSGLVAVAELARAIAMNAGR